MSIIKCTQKAWAFIVIDCIKHCLLWSQWTSLIYIILGSALRSRKYLVETRACKLHPSFGKKVLWKSLTELFVCFWIVRWGHFLLELCRNIPDIESLWNKFISELVSLWFLEKIVLIQYKSSISIKLFFKCITSVKNIFSKLH